jgi:large subunit ribosomal protein L4
MAKVDVIDIRKQKVGELEVDDRLLAEAEKPHLVYETVRMQLAGRRRGTAATKERSLISGGGRKPWKQKGTGRARAGHSRSPLWRGGGTVFGPHPRDYDYRPPKKVRQAALRSVLSAKFREEKLLKGLGVQSALLVIDDPDPVLEKSARNLPRILVCRWEGINVHDLLRFDHIVFLRSSLEKVERKLVS